MIITITTTTGILLAESVLEPVIPLPAN